MRIEDQTEDSGPWLAEVAQRMAMAAECSAVIVVGDADRSLVGAFVAEADELALCGQLRALADVIERNHLARLN